MNTNNRYTYRTIPDLGPDAFDEAMRTLEKEGYEVINVQMATVSIVRKDELSGADQIGGSETGFVVFLKKREWVRVQ